MQGKPLFARNKILEHFYSPKNCGEIAEPDGVGISRLEEHGIAHRFTIKVKNGRIADIKFQTAGCISSIASASVLTELAKGKELGEAESITPEEVSHALDGLPEEKMYCARLAVRTLGKAIEDYKKRR
jgi:nitrogen fixation NifU-like protein